MLLHICGYVYGTFSTEDFRAVMASAPPSGSFFVRGQGPKGSRNRDNDASPDRQKHTPRCSLTKPSPKCARCHHFHFGVSTSLSSAASSSTIQALYGVRQYKIAPRSERSAKFEKVSPVLKIALKPRLLRSRDWASSDSGDIRCLVW